jgi:very-short-patch-repair endonuclease
VRPDEAERQVLLLAGRQQGVVAWEQFTRLGLTAGWVRHRVARGWLRRRFRGVYLVGPLHTPQTDAMAAALAAGAGALVSHSAAAVLWGLRPEREGSIDVTVSGRKIRERPGIRVHRGRVCAGDATRQQGVPVTSPARTLLDLAATLPQRELDRAVEQAQVHRRVSAHSLNEQFSRYPTHRGTAALTDAIRPDPALTRSEAERRFLELIRAARLPEPEANVNVGGYEVDFLWRSEKLIVEVDGYAFHSSRSSFERDRRKDQALGAAGYRVIRITWRQLTDEREALIAQISRMIAPMTTLWSWR